MSTRPQGPEYKNTGPMFEPPEGFPFTQESAIRRHAEPALFALFPFVAGVTAMQDGIAAAVMEHSRFQERPWERLLGTVNSAITLIYGNEAESLTMAERMWNFHETVQGTHKGVGYAANDAALQTWVLRSVFTGFEEVKRRWSTPLLPSERQELYGDFKVFAKVFGIDESLLPTDIEAWDSYWENIIAGDTLLQTNISREMVQTVFRFNGPKVPSPLARIGQAIAITSLDPRLQERTGLQPNALDRRISAVVDVIMKNTYGRMPKQLREQAIPLYLATRRRIAPLLGRLSAAKTAA